MDAARWGIGGTTYNRIAQVLVYIGVILVPLFYLPWTSSVLEYNKQVFLVVLASVGLVVWLLGAVVSGKLTLRSSPVDKGVLGIFVASLVATIFSLSPAKSVFGLSVSLSSSLLTVTALTVFYFLAVTGSPDRGRTLRTALVVSLFVALLLGALQMFAYYFLPGGFTHSRAFTTVGALNSLGLLAAVALPLFAKTANQGGRAMTGLAIAGVAASIVVLSLLNWWVLWAVALAGMLAMIAFDSLNATRMAEDYGGRKRFALSRFVVPMVVVVIGAFLLLVDFNPASLKSNFPVEVAPSFGLSWQVTKGVLGDDLLTGWGPENFSLAFDRFGAGALAASRLSDLRFFDGTSEIFTIAVQLGALGILALALLFWCLVQATARFGGAISDSIARGQSAIFAQEASGTMAAAIAMTVALFLYPFNIVAWFVYVTLLALVALIVTNGSRTVDIEERPAFSLAASLGFIISLILVLSSIYFTATRFLSDVKYARALQAANADAAMEQIARAVELDPSNDRILRDASQLALVLVRQEVAKGNQGDATRVQNLVASAVQLAQRAAAVQPLESMNHNNLGMVYQSLTGLVADVEGMAEESFKKAGELRPGDPGFDNRTGSMWLARADLISSLATQQNAAQLREQYALSLDKAEESFKKALEKSPSFGLAIYNLGAVYDRKGEVSEAIGQLEKIVPFNADEPTLMFELGLLYLRAGRNDDAQAALTRAVLLAPQYANARWYLGLLLEDEGDREGALVQMREILKDNEDNEVLKAKISQLEATPPVRPEGDVIDNEPLE